MKWVLLDDVNESGGTELSRAAQQQWLGVYMAYMEARPKCRRAEDSGGLRSAPAATTVRSANDKAQAFDSPHADTKEQWGGFHTIDVASSTQILSWDCRQHHGPPLQR